MDIFENTLLKIGLSQHSILVLLSYLQIIMPLLVVVCVITTCVYCRFRKQTQTMNEIRAEHISENKQRKHNKSSNDYSTVTLNSLNENLIAIEDETDLLVSSPASKPFKQSRLTGQEKKEMAINMHNQTRNCSTMCFQNANYPFNNQCNLALLEHHERLVKKQSVSTQTLSKPGNMKRNSETQTLCVGINENNILKKKNVAVQTPLSLKSLKLEDRWQWDKYRLQVEDFEISENDRRWQNQCKPKDYSARNFVDLQKYYEENDNQNCEDRRLHHNYVFH